MDSLIPNSHHFDLFYGGKNALRASRWSGRVCARSVKLYRATLTLSYRDVTVTSQMLKYEHFPQNIVFERKMLYMLHEDC